MTDVNTREIVMDGLIAILEKGEFSHIVTGQILNKYIYLDKKDRAFISRLMAGTLENVYLLDDIIDRYSKVKVSKMKPVIRTILRMSVYQIYFMNGVKDFAAINEAVNLAKKRGFKNLSGFVNGVLRSTAKNAGTYELPKTLNIKYSVPEWLVNKFVSDYGYDNAVAILSGFTKQSGVTVRMNLSKGKSADDIKASLDMENVIFEDIKDRAEGALVLKEFDALSDITMLCEGYIQVQDVSAMYPVLMSGAKAGDNVIDVCAAPGGKSLHMADILNNTGHIEARDKTEYKAGLIADNLSRTEFRNISTKVWDATITDESAINTADIVIADLPCSGLGVLGKKPDIRYRIKEEDLTSLVTLQRQILSAVWQYVKPGGTLMYSTCTLNKAENEENVLWFIENFPFELEKPDDMVTIFPDEYSDGFFIAKLKRMK